jgi:hypothetical protein
MLCETVGQVLTANVFLGLMLSDLDARCGIDLTAEGAVTRNYEASAMPSSKPLPKLISKLVVSQSCDSRPAMQQTPHFVFVGGALA